MISGKFVTASKEQIHPLPPVLLFHLCASSRDNSDAWTEFLARYGGKIKYFIRGTLRQMLGSAADPSSAAFKSGMQESDLFQNTILRLIENDCAAMKRFSGDTENELLAYLAIISRSTVMDALRRSKAVKRQPTDNKSDNQRAEFSSPPQRTRGNVRMEQTILANELISLIHQNIQSHSLKTSGRDRLVFELYFFEGLSFSQISQCEGVQLSKAGVEKLLKRLISRTQESLHPIESR